MTDQVRCSFPLHPAWFCLKSQPKHEHIAALHLRRRIQEIDVFCPRLRIRKNTRRGPVWFIEPLFPGYLFAQFDPTKDVQSIKSTPGVSSIVSFGPLTPVIQDEIIRELRADFDEKELCEVSNEPSPGDNVTIATGPFQGFQAKIIRVLPGPQRVQVLMDILGRITPVEVAAHEIVREKTFPSFDSTGQGVLAKDESVQRISKGTREKNLGGQPDSKLHVATGQQMSR